METKGKLKSVSRDLITGNWIISFETEQLPVDLPENDTDLDIKAEKHRKKRSRNANALLWECLGRIAAVLRTDKWDVYLKMLRRYGEYTYICVKPKAVEMLKRQWRECESIGEININGMPAVQMLCYYGSSTYDTRQFAVLLDGVISEMKELGLETPEEETLRLSLEQWEGYEQKKQGV